MVSCLYCGEAWVREDTELVCQSCSPALKVDLAVADIAKAVKELEEVRPIEVRARVDILTSEYQALGEIIKKAKYGKDTQ